MELLSDNKKNCAVGLDWNPVADAPALTALRCVRPDKSGKEIKEQKELNLQWVEECAEDSSVTGEPLILNW